MAAAEITREYALKNNLTPNGKELTYVAVRGSHLLKLKFVNGGELPEDLSSLYVSASQANAAIQTYLNAKWDEAEKRVTKRATETKAA